MNRLIYDKQVLNIDDTLKLLEQKAIESNDDELACELKLRLYRKEFEEEKGQNDTIEKKMLELSTYAHDKNMHYLEADVLQTLGEYYFNNKKQQSEGLENDIYAYKIYRNFTNDEFPFKQLYLYDIGNTFYRYEDYDTALKYLNEAYNMKLRMLKNNCAITNNIGMCYRTLKKYDSAIYFFNKTYEEAIKINTKAWQGIATGNIGITYYLENRYDDAIPLLNNDIETSIATNNVKNAVSSMTILATIYYYKKDYNKAERLLIQAISSAENRPYWPDYKQADQIYTQLYKTYAAKNNFRNAYIYADSAIMAKDSLSKRNNTLILAKAQEKTEFTQNKLEAEKLQNQIKLDNVLIDKKRIETTFYIVGGVALLLVILFIARERKRSEDLLLNILPEKIAERLKKKEYPIADYFDNASILFIDMAGFTVYSHGRDPKEIVGMLNAVFTRFDELSGKYGLEKIKTIGDCYMAVSGLPEPNPDHAEAATQMALEIKHEMKDYQTADGTKLSFRIGLDCGPVVAGVIGRRKFIYDLWGDTVNTASRMESTGLSGEIHCSDRFKKRIETNHHFVSRGELEIKGKGKMETWLIIS